jgi:hypothetical protein
VASRNKSGSLIASMGERLPRKNAWQVLLGGSPLDEDYSPEPPPVVKQLPPLKRTSSLIEESRLAEAVVTSTSTYNRRAYLHCRTTKNQNVWFSEREWGILDNTPFTVVCKAWKTGDGVVPRVGDTIVFEVYQMKGLPRNGAYGVPKNSSFVRVVSKDE